MVKKKKATKKKDETINVILGALKEFIVPKILSSLKEKVHSEFNYFTSHVEQKFKSMTHYFAHKMLQLSLVLIAFIFCAMGAFYFFTDILQIPRTYILLGIGIILFIIVMFAEKKHHK